MSFSRDAEAVACCARPWEKSITLTLLSSSKYTEAHTQWKHGKNKCVSVTQLAKHLQFLPDQMWVLGRESLNPTSSKTQYWNSNVSTGVSLGAAVLLLGIEQENFYPLLVVSGFLSFILLEKKLSPHLEAELRDRVQ